MRILLIRPPSSSSTGTKHLCANLLNNLVAHMKVVMEYSIFTLHDKAARELSQHYSRSTSSQLMVFILVASPCDVKLLSSTITFLFTTLLVNKLFHHIRMLDQYDMLVFFQKREGGAHLPHPCVFDTTSPNSTSRMSYSSVHLWMMDNVSFKAQRALSYQIRCTWSTPHWILSLPYLHQHAMIRNRTHLCLHSI